MRLISDSRRARAVARSRASTIEARPRDGHLSANFCVWPPLFSYSRAARSSFAVGVFSFDTPNLRVSGARKLFAAAHHRERVRSSSVQLAIDDCGGDGGDNGEGGRKLSANAHARARLEGVRRPRQSSKNSRRSARSARAFNFADVEAAATAARVGHDRARARALAGRVKSSIRSTPNKLDRQYAGARAAIFA